MSMKVVSLYTRNGFTKGKTYTVESIDDIYYLITNDKGIVKHVWEKQFLHLDEYRKIRLEKLLK